MGRSNGTENNLLTSKNGEKNVIFKKCTHQMRGAIVSCTRFAVIAEEVYDNKINKARVVENLGLSRPWRRVQRK